MEELCCKEGMEMLTLSRKRREEGLTEDQAQKVLDYVCDRLNGVDNATAERLLDGFVDRLRGLNDIANVKRLIEEGDENSLKRLGGVEGARGMLYLVERIGRE
jgi:hypothetical protein